jgi:glutathione S-transferase
MECIEHVDWKMAFGVLTAVGVSAMIFRRVWPKPRLNLKEGIVYLHLARSNKKLWSTTPCGSPFGLKVEGFLRLHKIPYEIASWLPFSPRTNKMPWIEFKKDGKILEIDDSENIFDFLTQEFDIQEPALEPQQLALAHSMQRMMEDSFYWYVSRSRWGDNLQETTRRFGIPSLVGKFIVGPKVQAALRSQGVLRRPHEDALKFARRDLLALDTIVPDAGFLFGDRPTRFDVAIASHIASLIYQPILHDLRALTINEFPKIVAYVDRFIEFAWGEAWDNPPKPIKKSKLKSD